MSETLKPLFQSDDFWILSKPAGMSVHAEGPSPGVFESLRESYPAATFYPVHRLDKMTSGLLIVACTKEAASLFGSMFEQHQVQKYYLAISDQKPTKKQGTVSGGMAPSRRGQWKLTRSASNFAVTQFFSLSVLPGIRLFLLKPKTGKTHQIRVAMKSLGAPIMGDSRYGGSSSDRGYLHAFQLFFDWKGVEHHFISYPEQGELFSPQLKVVIEERFATPEALSWPKSPNVSRVPFE